MGLLEADLAHRLVRMVLESLEVFLASAQPLSQLTDPSNGKEPRPLVGLANHPLQVCRCPACGRRARGAIRRVRPIAQRDDLSNIDDTRQLDGAQMEVSVGGVASSRVEPEPEMGVQAARHGEAGPRAWIVAHVVHDRELLRQRAPEAQRRHARPRLPRTEAGSTDTSRAQAPDASARERPSVGAELLDPAAEHDPLMEDAHVAAAGLSERVVECRDGVRHRPTDQPHPGPQVERLFPDERLDGANAVARWLPLPPEGPRSRCTTG